MAETATTQSPGGTREEQESTSWWPLVAVCAGVFMLLVDITVVNVALPSIQADLHTSFADLQWVIDIYALTLASFQLIAGVLGDRLGRREVFIAGIGIFAAASLACGLAGSPLWLDVFRGVQGVGGSVMFANSLSIIGATYHGKDRGTAFGIWGATTGGSAAVGPLVGGALTTGIGWRWVFLINLPIALFAAAVALWRMDRVKPPRERKLDLPGFVLFSGALALLVYALVRGEEAGWTSAQILGCLIGSGVALVLFLLVEARSTGPMLDLGLFRSRTFVGAQVAAFSVSASIFGLFLYLTLYLQGIQGYSAFQSGLRLLPISGLAFVVAPIAGKISSRVPYRALVGPGLLLAAVGIALMNLLSASSSWLALLAGFVVVGVGIGLVNPPLGSLATASVPSESPGVGAGINNTFRQVGIATAVAAYGAVFQHAVRSDLAAHLPAGDSGSVSGLTQATSSGALDRAVQHVPAGARQQVREVATHAFVSGLGELFWTAAGVALLGGLLCLALIRQRELDQDG